MSDDLVFVDRYDALGFRPDPATMCPGQCEGIGTYPHPSAAPMTDAERAMNPAPVADADGWYWLTCPDCAGSGQRAAA